MNMFYHSSILVDTLSRVSMGSLAHIQEENKELAKDVHSCESSEFVKIFIGRGG